MLVEPMYAEGAGHPEKAFSNPRIPEPSNELMWCFSCAKTFPGQSMLSSKLPRLEHSELKKPLSSHRLTIDHSSRFPRYAGLSQLDNQIVNLIVQLRTLLFLDMPLPHVD